MEYIIIIMDKTLKVMQNMDIQIVLLAHFKNKLKFIFESETYSEGVLFLLKSGSFCFTDSDGEIATVVGGQAVWCPKNFCFKRTVVDPVDLYMIKFNTDLKLPTETTVFSVNDRTAQSLSLITPTFCTAPDIDTLTLHYCTDVCIESVRLLNCDTQNVAYALPQEVETLLSQHFTEDITNTMLCEIMHCSEATMIALVKKAKNKTPQQFITEKRLKLARRLLTETNEDIGIIAEKCGYRDRLYFSRLFKRMAGLTATEFRRKYRI